MSNHEADQNFIDNYKIKVGDTYFLNQYPDQKVYIIGKDREYVYFTYIYNCTIGSIHIKEFNEIYSLYNDSTESINNLVESNHISHPEHYTHSKIEAWDFLKDFPYLDGNAMKYIIRHKHKNGKEDLLKAKAYLDKMIKEYYES